MSSTDDLLPSRAGLQRARSWLGVGTVLSLLGFLLPWFKYGPQARWSYNGWDALVEGPDRYPSWAWLILVGHVVLLGAGWRLLSLDTDGALAVVALVVAVSLAVIVMLVLVMASSLDRYETNELREFNPTAGLGLLVLALGHGAMLAAAVAGLAAQVVAVERFEADSQARLEARRAERTAQAGPSKTDP